MNSAERRSVLSQAIDFAKKYVHKKGGNLHLVSFQGSDMIAQRDVELKRLQHSGGIDREISEKGPTKEQYESICYGYFRDTESLLKWACTDLGVRLGDII